MSLFIKRAALATTLLLSMSSLYAGPGPKPDDNAESCRQIALKLSWLSRYQDRWECTANLDGSGVYFASNYITANRINDAKYLLDNAIIKTKYAIDINCYGQDEMKEVVEQLQKIQKSL